VPFANDAFLPSDLAAALSGNLTELTNPLTPPGVLIKPGDADE
jgi:hypothetical protein